MLCPLKYSPVLGVVSQKRLKHHKRPVIKKQTGKLCLSLGERCRCSTQQPVTRQERRLLTNAQKQSNSKHARVRFTDGIINPHCRSVAELEIQDRSFDPQPQQLSRIGSFLPPCLFYTRWQQRGCIGKEGCSVFLTRKRQNVTTLGFSTN